MRWREWGAWALVLVAIAGMCVVLWHAPAWPAERCRASWYGRESGSRTATGERFDPDGLSIALPFRPRNERYRVCYRGRCIIVRHNDLGPARWTHRCADLSRGAARVLGFDRAGTAIVEIERARPWDR